MTQAKKLKRTIRRRAQKTGESYTAARTHVLAARRRPAPAAASPSAAPTPARASRRTTSDAAARQVTGRGFDHWFAVLDAFGAPAKGHTASARHLREEHGVPSWHCQMITVEYERERGLRATNQSGRGDFQVSVSRTLAAPIGVVLRLVTDARRRRTWLPGADAGLGRALQAGLTARGMTRKGETRAFMRFAWGASRVLLELNAKPSGKTLILASNEKLAGVAEVEGRRKAWKDAFTALRAALGA